MKKVILTLLSTSLLSISTMASDPKGTGAVKVDITSLSNVDNGSLEACGTAVHSAGLKPILVTVKHGNVSYTTLSSPDGNWCVVFKRHTFNGQSDAQGVALKDVLEN